MSRTVAFTRQATNVFCHILTACNLRCRHCYINPAQHGDATRSRKTIGTWLSAIAGRCSDPAAANLVLLGGEPTLHPDLAGIVRDARGLGYGSITIDTNGYLFHDILDRLAPGEVDYFSFSLDGPDPGTNDPIRGDGSFDRCTDGIRAAVRKGLTTSLICTVSRENIGALNRMPALVRDLGVDRFFIQVIGIRGQSAGAGDRLQLSRDEWFRAVPPAARAAAESGVTVTYPKVFLEPGEPFQCAGIAADNYFIFPNGRVYRCPLCEDYPIHGLRFDEAGRLVPTPPINEADLFRLSIPEGCVMNQLIQPDNIDYKEDGTPRHRIACCLLKEEIRGQRVPK